MHLFIVAVKFMLMRPCGREELRVLSQELEAYQPGLSRRCGFVVANKADLPKARQNIPRLREEAGAAGLKVVPASAMLGDNLSRVVKEMLRIREESRLVSIQRGRLLKQPTGSE